VVALKGELPSPAEYVEIVGPKLEGKTADIYKYLNFHQMTDFSV
jgi:aconitase B